MLSNVSEDINNWMRGMTYSNIGEGRANEMKANTKFKNIPFDSCLYNNRYCMFLHLPGIIQESIKISLSPTNILTIRAESRVPQFNDLEIWSKKIETERVRVNPGINPPFNPAFTSGEKANLQPIQFNLPQSQSIQQPQMQQDQLQQSLNLHWYHLENSYGLYSRDVMVPKNADVNNISSIYSNAILYIEVPILNPIQYQPVVV